MSFRSIALALLLAGTVANNGLAQSADASTARLYLELNTVQDTGGACRVTFLAQNETDLPIEKAVFETVIFDTSGGVISLSLFDFRALPPERPRVRQFDLPGITCDELGQILINGANTCLVDKAESGLCDEALSLGSRLELELLG